MVATPQLILPAPVTGSRNDSSEMRFELKLGITIRVQLAPDDLHDPAM